MLLLQFFSSNFCVYTHIYPFDLEDCDCKALLTNNTTWKYKTMRKIKLLGIIRKLYNTGNGFLMQYNEWNKYKNILFKFSNTIHKKDFPLMPFKHKTSSHTKKIQIFPSNIKLPKIKLLLLPCLMFAKCINTIFHSILQFQQQKWMRKKSA